jgi:Flp pilus assembly protein TadG
MWTWSPAQHVRERDDRGSAAIEMALLMIVFFILIGISVFVGRLHNASSEIESAARSAARDISLGRDTAQAVADAEDRAAAALDVGNPMCESMDFDEQFDSVEDSVTVTITCTVDLSEATFAPGLPGTETIDASATEVFDQYREREGP